MKTKPVLIILGILILLASLFLFVRGRYTAKPQKNEIYQFLALFNGQLQAGNTDSLLNYFETNKKKEVLTQLLNILANKSGARKGEKPLFQVALDIDKSEITSALFKSLIWL